MKIFTGEIPENPCEKCWYDNGCKGGCWQNVTNCSIYAHYSSQLSVLNQCVEVGNIDELADEWRNATTIYELPYKFTGTFSQFIQEQIKKQEGKDGQ